MSDFKGKTSKELVKTLIEKRNALQAFRLGNAGSKTKNVKEGKGLRKDIARIMTELNASAKTAAVAPEAKAEKAPKAKKAKVSKK
jgi:ribosomal protein L29